MRGFMLVVVGGLLALPHVVGAQVPAIVGFDGVLFTTGQCCGYSYEGPVTFRLCDSAGGACTLGGSAWEETHDPATVDGGYVHADLGAVVPLPATAFAGERWLEVELDEGIGALSPRIRLTSVPYAWQCLDAATVGGQAPGAFAPVSHQHTWSSVTGVPAALADGQVAWEEVAGKPATFPPAPHDHTTDDVTSLQAALNGKSATEHQHDATYAPIGHVHDDAYYTKLQIDERLGAKADAANVISWAEADQRYSPAAHDHEIADISGLQAVLDAKTDEGTCYTRAEVESLLNSLRQEFYDGLFQIAGASGALDCPVGSWGTSGYPLLQGLGSADRATVVGKSNAPGTFAYFWSNAAAGMGVMAAGAWEVPPNDLQTLTDNEYSVPTAHWATKTGATETNPATVSVNLGRLVAAKAVAVKVGITKPQYYQTDRHTFVLTDTSLRQLRLSVYCETSSGDAVVRLASSTDGASWLNKAEARFIENAACTKAIFDGVFILVYENATTAALPHGGARSLVLPTGAFPGMLGCSAAVAGASVQYRAFQVE